MIKVQEQRIFFGGIHTQKNVNIDSARIKKRNKGGICEDTFRNYKMTNTLSTCLRVNYLTV